MRKWERKWDEARKTSTFLSLLSSCTHHSFPSVSSFSDTPLIRHSPYLRQLLLSNTLPLTPQGSLSFPAFSSCFIYSLFNSLRCICFPFLSPWHPSPPALTTSLWFIYSFSRPLLVHHLASLSLCCISHTRWRHWVVYSYHLVGAFIFFTIHVLPSLSCKIFFSFNNLCSSFIVSLISPLDFLCFPLFDVESPFLLALSCFFFHVNSSLIGHSLHNWSPLNVISLYTTFITL